MSKEITAHDTKLRCATTTELSGPDDALLKRVAGSGDLHLHAAQIVFIPVTENGAKAGSEDVSDVEGFVVSSMASGLTTKAFGQNPVAGVQFTLASKLVETIGGIHTIMANASKSGDEGRVEQASEVMETLMSVVMTAYEFVETNGGTK